MLDRRGAKVKVTSASDGALWGARGQAAVEFTLLLPLFLVFVFLIFEVGRLFGSWMLITNAAREGARVAVVQPSSCLSDSACTGASGPIRAKVAQTAQFLSVQTTDCQNNQPPSGATSCMRVIPCISGASNNDALCPQSSSTDNFYVVLVEYQVQTLMPINGQVPFIGAISYPGFLEVVGLSAMRAE